MLNVNSCGFCQKDLDTEEENYIHTYVMGEDVLFHLHCLPKSVQNEIVSHYGKSLIEAYQWEIRKDMKRKGSGSLPIDSHQD